MTRKSAMAPGVILKSALPILTQPWMLKSLLNIEKDKLLFERLHRNCQDGRAEKIRQLSIRITDRCNLRCHTCGQWGDNGFLRDREIRSLTQREISPRRYMELLDDLAGHGQRPTLYLWGGEPMLYKGTPDILEHATRLGMPSMIATNGTGLKGAAAHFASLPMFLLQVSIDGPDAATHNAARPAAAGGDNFADIVAGLEQMKEEKARQGRKLPLVAALTTISTANYRRLTDIYEAFRDKVDFFIFYLAWWIDEASAKAHEEDFARRFGFKPTLHWGWCGDWVNRDAKTLSDQLKELERRSAPWGAPAVNILPRLVEQQDLERYYSDHSARFGFERCISIFRAVEIDSNGDMSPCRDYHDYVVGNVGQSSITELWNNAAYRKFRASLAREGLMPVCRRCCGLMGY